MSSYSSESSDEDSYSENEGAEKYLKQLIENNCWLTEVERTHPPEYSNFYWKNYAKKKYKVFIPTPNRKVYYTLKEYETGDLDINEIFHDETLITKCVMLAVSKELTDDQPFIYHMERFITEMSRDIRNHLSGTVPNYEKKNCDRNLYRHFVLTKYLIDDKFILVPIELRGKCASFRLIVSVHPDNDPESIIPMMEIGFELAAERFINDREHGVYEYGRPSNYY